MNGFFLMNAVQATAIIAAVFVVSLLVLGLRVWKDWQHPACRALLLVGVFVGCWCFVLAGRGTAARLRALPGLQPRLESPDNSRETSGHTRGRIASRSLRGREFTRQCETASEHWGY